MRKIVLILMLLALGCTESPRKKSVEKITSQTEVSENKPRKIYPVSKTEKEWKAQLNEMEYFVLRQKGTERPFVGKYDKFYGKGSYVCAACGIKLYESEHKFNSGTGWPSFDRGYDENLEYEADTSHGMSRTEVKCANCGGHLGHVFNDGPRETTGIRHCINSVSLQFVSAYEPK
ncbi:peptide-methionine (R)-S-oxide reductase MsrB [Leptobacterium flavescens]|uniref:peptide-methionine (R)-S-oxide reductase n=1 Tax=Leptobacterium flavescens TaxID=472055 RepID=A0A6P0ULG7_9FLAO|nr:peptide-methionine (R)-S-oxide reductase MsrB [Leptobacterium flavescens]NER14074.1 peptide-methionine (R)-S-oxide reductase MsrB [Leptobacterium flavescens]